MAEPCDFTPKIYLLACWKTKVGNKTDHPLLSGRTTPLQRNLLPISLCFLFSGYSSKISGSLETRVSTVFLKYKEDKFLSAQNMSKLNVNYAWGSGATRDYGITFAVTSHYSIGTIALERSSHRRDSILQLPVILTLPLFSPVIVLCFQSAASSTTPPEGVHADSINNNHIGQSSFIIHL